VPKARARDLVAAGYKPLGFGLSVESLAYCAAVGEVSHPVLQTTSRFLSLYILFLSNLTACFVDVAEQSE